MGANRKCNRTMPKQRLPTRVQKQKTKTIERITDFSRRQEQGREARAEHLEKSKELTSKHKGIK